MIKAAHAQSAFQYACFAFAVWFAGCFLYVALVSLVYPHHLEWMEGHTVDIIQRIRDGLPFYTKPSLEYVPYIYTPLYFYVSAFVSLFTGVDFFAPRLVSLLSTLGAAWILYSWIRKEQGEKVLGLVTAGLFLATYKISGRWFDVARVDSLYLFLMAAGLYVFYFCQKKHDGYIAALLFAAAFFVKQSALLALFPCLIAGLFIDRKRALKVALATGVIIIAGCIYLQDISYGWFAFYIYDVPAGHPNDRLQFVSFWRNDLFPICVYMMTLSACAFFLLFKAGWKPLIWYLAIAIGFIGSAYISRIHSFGHVNVLMPAHYAMALLTGVALIYSKKWNRYAGLIVCMLVTVQFYNLVYKVNRMLPTEEARKKGDTFLVEMKKIPEDILFSELQFVQSRIGKKNYSIGMAGFDIMRSDLGEKNDIKNEYIRELETAVRRKQFSAIVTGSFIMRINELQGNYRLDRVIDQPQEFVTGAVFFNRASVFVPARK